MLSKKKILVVDDDPEMRLALQIRLNANNYETAFAVDGVSCISEARKQLPALILLDLGLPAGDGFVVLERLRALDELSRIPVIVISGRDRLISRDLVIKAGAKLFMQKPVRHSDLLLAIDHTLRVPSTVPPVVYDLKYSDSPLA